MIKVFKMEGVRQSGKTTKAIEIAEAFAKGGNGVWIIVKNNEVARYYYPKIKGNVGVIRNMKNILGVLKPDVIILDDLDIEDVDFGDNEIEAKVVEMLKKLDGGLMINKDGELGYNSSEKDFIIKNYTKFKPRLRYDLNILSTLQVDPDVDFFPSDTTGIMKLSEEPKYLKNGLVFDLQEIRKEDGDPIIIETYKITKGFITSLSDYSIEIRGVDGRIYILTPDQIQNGTVKLIK